MSESRPLDSPQEPEPRLNLVHRIRAGVRKERVLLENFAYLMTLQALNYLLPLLTVPYLVRVLGPEKFGLIAFAQAFAQYFVLVTDYGFNFSAPRDISIQRENKAAVTEIFNTIMVIKVAALVLGFCVLTAIVILVPKFRADALIYYITFGSVLGNVLFPIWFFQGMERMKYITYLNLVSKIIFTVAIFIFVTGADDYLVVPFLSTVGSIVSGGLGFIIVLRDFGIRFGIPKVETVLKELRAGWGIFISTIAISLYTTSNVFILGLFAGNTVVGYFSAGERIIRASQGLLTPFAQAVYPRVSKLASTSRQEALRFVRRCLGLIAPPMFVLSLCLFLFAAPISNLVLGKQYQESIAVIRILAFLPFILGLATVFANFFLLAFGYTRIWSSVIIGSSIVSVVGAFLFVYVFRMEHIGISVNLLLTEAIVLAFSWVMYHRLANRESLAGTGLPLAM